MLMAGQDPVVFKFVENMHNVCPSVEREGRAQVMLYIGHSLKEKSRGRPKRVFEGKDVLHERMRLDLHRERERE
jgi:hypothetical protein